MIGVEEKGILWDGDLPFDASKTLQGPFAGEGAI